MVEVKNDKAVPEAWSLDMAVQTEAPVPVLQSPSLAVKVTPISLDTPSGNCLTSHSYSYYYTAMELPFVAHTVTLPSMAQPWRLGRIYSRQPAHRPRNSIPPLNNELFCLFSSRGKAPFLLISLNHKDPVDAAYTWLRKATYMTLPKDFLVEPTLRSSASLLRVEASLG